jgi:hypothetical protein
VQSAVTNNTRSRAASSKPPTARKPANSTHARNGALHLSVAPVPATIDEVPMSREDAAEFLGYSLHTMNNLAVLKKGPPYYSSGKKTWYLKSEMMSWMKSLPQGGSSAH